MLSLFAIAVALIAIVLAVPAVNDLALKILPESFAPGLSAWRRIAPRLMHFLIRRTKRKLVTIESLEEIFRFTSVATGFKNIEKNFLA